MKHIALIAAAVLSLNACATAPEPASPQDVFMARLNALCGQRFEGRVVTSDPADAGFASSRLLMHVRDCAANEVRIPFWVGEDHSRTWVITRTSKGVRLKHDHRHTDGTEDALSQYGGDTADHGTARRQAFPVDQFSMAMFSRQDRAVSNTNVWAVEVEPGEVFAYELRRPEGRFFRVEFDLARPVANPVQ
ncbi:hypothetical protein [Brevundimonas sp.]|uniref:hypothetical protein n=1 Tax=Brevundimonas sp. TaxID=1871086 RepID=UPI0035691773